MVGKQNKENYHIVEFKKEKVWGGENAIIEMSYRSCLYIFEINPLLLHLL